MVDLVKVLRGNNTILVDATTLSAIGAQTVLSNVPCDASVYVGAAVRMDALGTAYNAIATGVATSNVLGIVESKPTPTTCDIRVSGYTSTIFLGLDVTKNYYLSATVAGEVTDVIPVTSGHVMAPLGKPYSATQLAVFVGERVVRS